VKTVSWYDNEMSYVSQLVRTVNFFAKLISKYMSTNFLPQQTDICFGIFICTLRQRMRCHSHTT
jgi:hypothetical protein